MVGSVFGSYLVLAQDKTSHPSAAARYWKIRCIYCGEEKSIRSDGLKKCPICKCQKDKMIGNTFGDFLVLEKSKEKAKDNCLKYKCQCIHCGNIEEVASNVLRSQRKHCSNCHSRASTLIDLTGKTYGFLKVLYRDTSPIYMGHENDAYWVCQCLKCGSIKTIRGHSLRNGLTQSCGCIKSFGEEQIATILINNDILFQREYIFDDCYLTNKKNKLRFDFAIFNADGTLSHLVEYDGKQHFEENIRNSGWNTRDNYEQTHLRDEYKNNYCKSHHIKLIRIKYNEEITLQKILGE